MKRKKLFAAYESIWERIFLFYSGCCVVLLALGTALWLGASTNLLQFYVVAALCLAVLCWVGHYAFKARVVIYTDGIQVIGYPFFEWRHLRQARFVFLSSARAALSPDEELEIVPVKKFKWRVFWWRRWFLKEDFCKRIIVPFWSLPEPARTKLLQELGNYMPVHQAPTLRADEHTRLFLRRLFFMIVDAMGLIILVLIGYFVFLFFGDALYLAGNIY